MQNVRSGDVNHVYVIALDCGLPIDCCFLPAPSIGHGLQTRAVAAANDLRSKSKPGRKKTPHLTYRIAVHGCKKAVTPQRDSEDFAKCRHDRSRLPDCSPELGVWKSS